MPLSLPAYLVRELREHLAARVVDDPEALLFLGRTGRPLRCNSWNADHEKAKRARARKTKKTKLIKGDVARTLHDEKEGPPRSDDQGR